MWAKLWLLFMDSPAVAGAGRIPRFDHCTAGRSACCNCGLVNQLSHHGRSPWISPIIKIRLFNPSRRHPSYRRPHPLHRPTRTKAALAATGIMNPHPSIVSQANALRNSQALCTSQSFASFQVSESITSRGRRMATERDFFAASGSFHSGLKNVSRFGQLRRCIGTSRSRRCQSSCAS